MMASLSDRNIAMLRDRVSGATLKEIGQKHGVCTARARQIVFSIVDKIADEAKRREDIEDWRNERRELLVKIAHLEGLVTSKGRCDYGISVGELDLSIRSLNRISAAGLQTVGDVAALTDAELLRLPNFSSRSLREVRCAIDGFMAARARAGGAG